MKERIMNINKFKTSLGKNYADWEEILRSDLKGSGFSYRLDGCDLIVYDTRPKSIHIFDRTFHRCESCYCDTVVSDEDSGEQVPVPFRDYKKETIEGVEFWTQIQDKTSVIVCNPDDYNNEDRWMSPRDIGVCSGRHPMPVTDYIYGEIENPMDMERLELDAEAKLKEIGSGYINLYVTGLTVALVAILNVCHRAKINITLYHFDRDSGQYVPQKVI